MLIDTTSKTLLAMIIAISTYLIGSINEVVFILFVFMSFDYTTGVAVAIKDKTFDINKGIWGIVRKIFYVKIIIIAFLTNYVLVWTVNTLGMEFSYAKVFGYMMVIFFIAQDGISMYNNWRKLGIKLPIAFLKVFEKLADIFNQK